MARCQIGLMTMPDLEEAKNLHERVTKGLSREIYIPTSDEDMERLLGYEGIALGVWFQERLICMRAVATDKEWIRHIMESMDLAPDPDNRTAYTKHCIVDKDFRGNNVQFLTQYAIENQISDNFDTILTTVSPKNIFSIQNILACNFVVVALKMINGEYMRYIMRKNFRSDLSIWTNGHLVIPSSDFERQREVLAEGYVGYKRIRKHRGFSILYAPMSKEPPRGY
ncbi:MAG: hypothetical protein LBQ58_08140 [Synergistaceae bacterium]|nr:hypothetical protein [Synergistaceae bacterium]